VIGWGAGALAVVAFVASGSWQPSPTDRAIHTPDRGRGRSLPAGRAAGDLFPAWSPVRDVRWGDEQIVRLHARLLDDLEAIEALLRRRREDHWAEWIDRVRQRICWVRR
jgi:hypothetical protein